MLPLLADEDTLARFVSDYLDVPEHMRVEPWGRYVYVLAANYETITSDLNPDARFKVREISFTVPVKLYAPDDEDSSSGPAPDGSDTTAFPHRAFDTREEQEKWLRRAEKLMGVGLVTPFNYVDDMGAAITESEIFGVPSLRCQIDSPPVGWNGESSDEGVLLEIKAMVVPMLGVGAQGTRRTLLQIRDNPMIPADKTGEWNDIAAQWSGLLADDLEAKSRERGYRKEDASLQIRTETAEASDAKDEAERPQQLKPTAIKSARRHGHSEEDWAHFSSAFDVGRGGAMRLLAGLGSFNMLGLKQFRDASEPDKSCYKAIVSRPTRFHHVHSIEEMEKDVTLSILNFPTHPLAEKLGLIRKRQVSTDEGVLDQFEPIRPFTITADIVKERGRTLFERLGDEKWEAVDLADDIGWSPADRDKLESYLHLKPRPKLTYVWEDPETDKTMRVGPIDLDDTSLAEFKDRAEKRPPKDVKLLSRNVPLGTLWRLYGLKAMDQGRIEDLDLFARSRLAEAPPTDESGAPLSDDFLATMKPRELAGDLEFVSPAKLADSILSRRWCAPFEEDWLKRANFHIRRNTLGPSLAGKLFPRNECQGDVWPLSHHAQHRFNDGAIALFNQFMVEISALIDVNAAAQGGSFMAQAGFMQSEPPKLHSVMRRTFPDWFCEDIFATPAARRSIQDIWDDMNIDRIEQLRRSVRPFFAAANASVRGENPKTKIKKSDKTADEVYAGLTPQQIWSFRERWERRLKRISKDMVTKTRSQKLDQAATLLRERISEAPFRKL